MAQARDGHDPEILEMALAGYLAERQKIDGRIARIQALLGRKSPARTDGAGDRSGTKRVLSAAARERIAAAQRKRWAEHRRRKAAAR